MAVYKFEFPGLPREEWPDCLGVNEAAELFDDHLSVGEVLLLRSHSNTLKAKGIVKSISLPDEGGVSVVEVDILRQ